MDGARPLILLLEDDDAAADALAFVLGDWGADVAHGVSVGELLSAAGPRIHQASMIITDFHLGDANNGVSLARELSAHAPHARVLVLSGATSREAERAASEAGFAFLQKPARPEEIIAWLERG